MNKERINIMVKKIARVSAVIMFLLSALLLFACIAVFTSDDNQHSLLSKSIVTIFFFGIPMHIGVWMHRYAQSNGKQKNSFKTKPVNLDIKDKAKCKTPKQKLKDSALFILLFLIFSYKIFLPDIFDPIFYDVCSAEYINPKVEKVLDNSINGTKRQKDRLKKAFEPIEKHQDISENDLLEMKKGIINLVYLKKNNCPITGKAKADVITLINYPDESNGSKICPETLFFKENLEKINQITNYPSLYKKLEDTYLKTISEKINQPEFRMLFKEKWQDAQYRKSIIVSAMQIKDRKENGCKNVNLPLNKFLIDFIDHAL